jgi:alkylation response protein AidB-like acyl-CoA dehydrogenase
LVLVRTDPDEGLQGMSSLLVEKDAPAVVAGADAVQGLAGSSPLKRNGNAWRTTETS